MDIFNLTPEEKKKLGDKNWRVNNLYKIRNRKDKVIKFKRNLAQAHFNKNKHSRNIILKSRRIGFTTEEVIDMADDALWTPNFHCIMLSYDKDSALDIFDDKVLFAWENYPPELKELLDVDTKRANKLKFGWRDGRSSSISVRSRARSGGYSRIHVSEFGKICKESYLKAKEIISGTFPTVPLGGRIDIESTAEGEIGAFHDMFWEAWNRQGEPLPNEFKAHFYNWTWDVEEMETVSIVIPFDDMDKGNIFSDYAIKHKLSDIQITYYYMKWIGLNKDWNTLHQEYPTTPEEAFISSGNKLFDMEKIGLQVQRYVKDAESIGLWKIYEGYRTGHLYAIGADPAEGVGGDNTAAVVWDFTLRPKIVATLRNDRLDPASFAYELSWAGKLFGTCLIAPERNNHGHAVIQKLREIYPENKIFKEIKYDTELEQDTKKFGWLTTGASKPKLLYDLMTAVNEDYIEVMCPNVLEELRTYEREEINKVRPDKDQIKHWDLVMAAAIGYAMRSHIEDVGEQQPQTTHENLHSEI